MLKTSLAAALAAAALTMQPPAALADHTEADCALHTVNQQDITGDTWEGVVHGYVIGPHDEAVKVECVLRVDGAVATTSGVGEGTGVAVVASRLSYRATAGQTVNLCVRAFSTAHGWRETCAWVPTLPGERLARFLVRHAGATVDEALIRYVDPALCDVVDDHPGTYGVVTTNEQGDVFVGADWVWDCPPYDLSGA